jgi:hypothetical protein
VVVVSVFVTLRSFVESKEQDGISGRMFSFNLEDWSSNLSDVKKWDQPSFLNLINQKSCLARRESIYLFYDFGT